MNILLHRVKDTEFDILHDENLFSEWETLREFKPAKPSFDASGANPLLMNAPEPPNRQG